MRQGVAENTGVQSIKEHIQRRRDTITLSPKCNRGSIAPDKCVGCH
jgi:hypothetical protein